MRFVDAYVEDGETDVRVGRCGARGLHAFALELARDRVARMVPRHSFDYRIEWLVGGEWLLLQSQPSLAHAVARIERMSFGGFSTTTRRIVCEGVVLGEVGPRQSWFDAA